MRRIAFLTSLLWPLLAVADDPASWIERMNGAMHGLAYRGVVVYVRGGQLQAIEVERRFEGGAPVDVLRTLTGEPRELVRTGGRLEQRSATSGPVTIDDAIDVPWPSGGAGPVAELERVYRLTLTGEARVAGRPAVVVDAIPRDDARYGYRLWLERDTGLLLGSAVLTAAGQLLEQSMFTQVHVEAAPAAAPASGGATSPPVSPPPGWAVTALPPGFRLVAARERAGGGRQLVYSDGLASASVYIEPGPPRLVGHAQRALMRAYGYGADGYHVVAVGELPPAALERIARSVRRTD
jgi:sigma-E factor negative regulatory protein RseB